MIIGFQCSLLNLLKINSNLFRLIRLIILNLNLIYWFLLTGFYLCTTAYAQICEGKCILVLLEGACTHICLLANVFRSLY